MIVKMYPKAARIKFRYLPIADSAVLVLMLNNEFYHQFPFLSMSYSKRNYCKTIRKPLLILFRLQAGYLADPPFSLFCIKYYLVRWTTKTGKLCSKPSKAEVKASRFADNAPLKW